MDVTDDDLSSNLPEQPSTSHNDEVSCSADRNSSTGHHLSMQAQSEMDISSPKFDDASSLSNPESFLLTRISLNWNVDFVNQKVFGSAKLAVLQKKSGENELFLDSRKLEIHSVHNAETGEALDFAIEAHSASEVIGQRLKIKLPHSAKESAIGTIWIVVIEYSTSPKSEALHWMPAAQTVSQKFPYVYSHCQAIHARSLFPCQDTPFVKFTYDASVKVAKDLTALMSAISVSSVQSEDGRTFVFEQKVPIPSYLVALAVGALESRDVGHRTRVWSEPEAVDAAELEFAETEKYIHEATTLMDCQKYVWDRCDLLILPPSFPYGGMENPCLIFVTPSLLAGEKPLVDAIARGIGYHTGRQMPKRRTIKSKKSLFGGCTVFNYFHDRLCANDVGTVEASRTEVMHSSVEQKVQDLPLLRVEDPFEFTPTVKFLHLFSSGGSLPGAFQQRGGLQAALSRRLPLSLGDDLTYEFADDPAEMAIFDASGAKVASVEEPEELCDSPLCDFIASAALTCRVGGSYPNYQLYVVNGDALLSHLPQLTELTLLHRDFRYVHVSVKHGEQRSLLASALEPLLPKLKALAFHDTPSDTLADFLEQLPLYQMTALRRLVVPGRAFSGVMTHTAAENPAVRDATLCVLAGLSSLDVWQDSPYERDEVSNMLQFITTHCTQLSSLFLRFCGELEDYLAAFRALPGLTTLGLELFGTVRLGGLCFSEDEKVITVTDLRIIGSSGSTCVFSLASFFPNATAACFQSTSGVPDALGLALDLCTKKVLPGLKRLSCFHANVFSFSSSEMLTRFIANSNLPSAVDLSPMLFESASRDPGFLTSVFQAMQSNSVKCLLLRGPVHFEALPRLKSHVDLNGESAKITAEKGRDLDEQPVLFSNEELSEQMEIEIVGKKTSGSLKGETFTVRVLHQLYKLSHIFD